MILELDQEVALTRDFPEHQLQRGDIAILLDTIPNAKGAEQSCILEIFKGMDPVPVVVKVPISAVKPLSVR